MEEAIKEIGKDIFSIKEQLKALNSLDEIKKKLDDLNSLLSSKNIEVDASFIDELVKHTTKCDNCRKALQDALNKYYRVVDVDKLRKSIKRGKASRK